MMQSLVIDANIAIKLFKHESDSDQALALFKYCNRGLAQLFVPAHFIFEVQNVARRIGMLIQMTHLMPSMDVANFNCHNP